MKELLYVYAFLPAGTDVGRVEGIGGRAIEVLGDGELAAAVSSVPADEFEEEPLNRLMPDMRWLAPRATAHQAANAALMERADAVLPLSFGTVYRDAEGVRRTLRARRDELRARLDAVRGRSEWVATLQRDEPRALDAAEADDPELARLRREMAAAGPGRAFLLRSRLEDARRAALGRLDQAATEAALAGLGALVERIQAEPIVRSAPEAPLARASLLVRRADEGRLVERAAELARGWEARGYALRLTGPWPPYRFGGGATEEAGAAAG